MNTQTQEALQMALESHKNNERHNTNAETKYWCEQYRMLCEKILETIEQPAQEPVAWMAKMGSFTAIAETKKQLPKGTEPIALYTHPAQLKRLSDDELREISNNCFREQKNHEKAILNALAIKNGMELSDE